MSPLPFPTDNLYKFVALAGAAMLITSLAFPLTRLDEIELAAQQTSAQRKTLDVEVAALEADVAQLTADVKRIDGAAQADLRPGSRLQDETNQARNRLVDLDKRRLALAVKRAEIQGNEEKNNLLLQQMKRTWSYLKVGSVAGLLMTLVGFFLWYQRVQRPADLEAKRRAGSGDA